MTQQHPDEWDFDEEFDGGEETCSRVIINLYTNLLPMPPGTRIMLISKDPRSAATAPSCERPFPPAGMWVKNWDTQHT